MLVQANFGTRNDLNIRGVPVGRHLTDNTLWKTPTHPRSQGSIIAISTGNDVRDKGQNVEANVRYVPDLDPLFLATVEATEEAIINSLVATQTKYLP